MGLRFRKSVKICKGVRINFSKSGASLSLGGRGATLNVGKRGMRSTVGIPGTGLSYSEYSSFNNKKNVTNRSKKTVYHKIDFHVDDNGKVSFYENGKEIFDESLIRKIKTSPDYKAQIERIKRDRIAEHNQQIKAAKEENDAFINICRLSAKVDSLSDFNNQYKALRVQEFNIPAPTEESVYKLLLEDADRVIKSPFWRKNKDKREFANKLLSQRLSEELENWNEEKKKAESQYQQDFEAESSFMQAVINGEENEVCKILENWIASVELPVEMMINYDYQKDKQSMYLDVDLPEIEDIPSTYLDQTTTGVLKEKKKTQETLRNEYATCVMGLAIFICSNVFNVSPAIGLITISGYTQRRDKSGDINDDYIFSIRFKREMFEGEKLSGVDPVDFCLKAENRCNMTKTSLFKAIIPFSESDS